VSPISLLLSLFAVDFLVVVSPGPAFLIVTQVAARKGTRAGLAATLGVLVSAMIWCAVVLSGLTILFRIAPWLYVAMKIGGGLYLAYMGFMLLRGGNAAAPAPANGASATSLARSFRKGLLVGLTNPKAVVYFSSIFTLFLKPGSPLWLDVAGVAIVALDTSVWYGFMGVLFSRDRVRHLFERLQHWVERVAGAVMLGLGVRLVLARD
jgi:RhtB (resistance to homoserine/threonine) family protein